MGHFFTPKFLPIFDDFSNKLEKSSNMAKFWGVKIKQKPSSALIGASKSFKKSGSTRPITNYFFVVYILGFLVNDPLCQERPAPDHDNDCCVQVVCASEASKEISSSPTITVSKNRQTMLFFRKFDS